MPSPAVPAQVRPHRPLRQRLWFRVALGVVVALLAFGAWYVSPWGRETTTVWALDRGFHRFDKRANFYKSLLAIPGRRLAAADVPHLDVAIKPKHWQQLAAMRAAALQKGLLEESEQGVVPATLSIGDRAMAVDVRLKGDYTDHLEGNKWSFRIEVTDDGEFEGMRRFSLQDPRTKGFHGEQLYYATLQRLGVLVPRYRFVTARIGPLDCGVMAVEEHVAKELLESQGRREGPIVHWDEAMLFWGRDDYRETTVVPFGLKKLLKVPALAGQLPVAVDLLRAFTDGVRAPSQVFAVEPLAGMIAAATFWGSWHGQRWHNTRFAFDPVLQRLEPIGYDANLQMHRPLPAIVAHEEDWLQRALADDVVAAATVRRLHELCAAVADGSLLTILRDVEQRALPALHREFWLLDAFPIAELQERAAFFAKVDVAGLRRKHLGALPLRACSTVQGADVVLELTADAPTTIAAIRWCTRDGSGATLPWTLRTEAEWPLRVPAGGRLSLRGLPCGDPRFTGLELELVEAGSKVVQRVAGNPVPTGGRALPESTIAAQLQAHPFLRAEEAVLQLAGAHDLSTHLIVPAGCSLQIAAGSELRFGPGVALIAHGPVHVGGTAAAPVRLTASDPHRGWLGVAVIAPGGVSTWTHAHVSHTTGVAIDSWTLTGAVTFAHGPVVLQDCTFEHNRAEDALNVITGHVQIERCAFADTISDAFDGDFVTGRVADVRFSRITGDGLDISGADLDIENVTAVDVRDKAVSVGERSSARVRSVRAERVGTGIACKDGSRLTLTDVVVESPAVAGVMAYTKKAEFGPAVIDATLVVVRGQERALLVQHGSSLTLDGKAIAAVPLDVDELYATVMRKR
ncbi:MAG: hypothetical protein IPK26_14505 [Planctomycetes bacterium]|nr:hypothetical protein [Planctomycetota bacterium]